MPTAFQPSAIRRSPLLRALVSVLLEFALGLTTARTGPYRGDNFHSAALLPRIIASQPVSVRESATLVKPVDHGFSAEVVATAHKRMATYTQRTRSMNRRSSLRSSSPRPGHRKPRSQTGRLCEGPMARGSSSCSRSTGRRSVHSLCPCEQIPTSARSGEWDSCGRSHAVQEERPSQLRRHHRMRHLLLVCQQVHGRRSHASDARAASSA
jgi:hypothetical protein